MTAVNLIVALTAFPRTAKSKNFLRIDSAPLKQGCLSAGFRVGGVLPLQIHRQMDSGLAAPIATWRSRSAALFSISSK